MCLTFKGVTAFHLKSSFSTQNGGFLGDREKKNSVDFVAPAFFNHIFFYSHRIEKHPS